MVGYHFGIVVSHSSKKPFDTVTAHCSTQFAGDGEANTAFGITIYYQTVESKVGSGKEATLVIDCLEIPVLAQTKLLLQGAKTRSMVHRTLYLISSHREGKRPHTVAFWLGLWILAEEP